MHPAFLHSSSSSSIEYSLDSVVMVRPNRLASIFRRNRHSDDQRGGGEGEGVEVEAPDPSTSTLSNNNNDKDGSVDLMKKPQSSADTQSHETTSNNNCMGNISSSVDSCVSGQESTKESALTAVKMTQHTGVNASTNFEIGELDSLVESSSDNEDNKQQQHHHHNQHNHHHNQHEHHHHHHLIFLSHVSHAFQAAGHAVGEKFNEVGQHVNHVGQHVNQVRKNIFTNHRPKTTTNKRRSSRKIRPAAGISSSSSSVTRIRGGIRLQGCQTDEEHKQYVRELVEKLRPLKGWEGLKVAGFEYRVVPLDYKNSEDNTNHSHSSNASCNEKKENVPLVSDEENNHDNLQKEEGSPDATSASTTSTDHSTEMDQNDKPNAKDKEEVVENQEAPRNSESERTEETAEKEDSCSEKTTETMTRLFHALSNTMITGKNRRLFIADGDMYDAIARLCQEYAQEIMIQEGNMEWVVVSEAGNNPEPIRALVNGALSEDDSLLDRKPTLLVATGKGKVRAGIFSRQHIMISGLECSTALPIVREAKKRQMNVVMLDPNAHGERLGMVTFEKSMARLFRRWETKDTKNADAENETCPDDQPPLAKRDLFVLSHSQSGAQLARYLLEKSEHYVPHIRAVAFTDATHNIQWAKEKEDLHQLLQSDKCVYFKCSKEHSDDALQPLHTVGQQVETDSFWEHRFGTINTRCAGTSEHSLTNWFVRSHIWEHFDKFMARVSKHSRTSVDEALSQFAGEQ